MAKQKGPRFISGTFDGLTYYKLNGRYYVRKKSSLSRRRVKRSPAFQRTMEYAGLLGRASKLAAEVYRMLPKGQRHVERYREWTGQAMQLLKEGLEVEEVKVRLSGVKGAGNSGEKVASARPRVVPVRKYVPVFCVKRPVGQRRKGVLRGRLYSAGGKRYSVNLPIVTRCGAHKNVSNGESKSFFYQSAEPAGP